jgi:hypothetical protein
MQIDADRARIGICGGPRRVGFQAYSHRRAYAISEPNATANVYSQDGGPEAWTVAMRLDLGAALNRRVQS